MSLRNKLKRGLKGRISSPAILYTCKSRKGYHLAVMSRLQGRKRFQEDCFVPFFEELCLVPVRVQVAAASCACGTEVGC